MKKNLNHIFSVQLNMFVYFRWMHDSRMSKSFKAQSTFKQYFHIIVAIKYMYSTENYYINNKEYIFLKKYSLANHHQKDTQYCTV